MMGFGEEGKKFPQKFFPSSPITKQPLSGTELLKKNQKKFFSGLILEKNGLYWNRMEKYRLF